MENTHEKIDGYINEIPIIDAHLHLWDPGLIRYPWLDNNKFLNKKCLLGDFNKASRSVDVEKMIFVQCECDQNQYMKEAEWVTEQAKIDKRIQAIIPWVPLESGEKVQEDLDILAENKLVKGIRRIIEFEEDMEFCLRSSFIKGVQLLERYNYSFDINIAHYQFENTIKFVRQCPDVQFILDHAGKPCIREGIFDSWKKNMRELAKMPNVYCKMSGLTTEANREIWTAEDLKPYIFEIIESFGFDRIAFGGDWPVVTQASEYSKWVSTLLEVLKGCSKEELKKSFHDNAERFYKLL